MPSNLTEIPKVSEKYEMKSFNFGSDVQSNGLRSNLKTMELL